MSVVNVRKCYWPFKIPIYLILPIPYLSLTLITLISVLDNCNLTEIGCKVGFERSATSGS